jgi:diaminopimelate epimerase
MEVIPFIKMHGLGNDFIIIDLRLHPLKLTEAMIARLSDRRLGVGCDTLVTLETAKEHACLLRFYNADGSESSACGNATRCVAYLEMSRSGETEVTLQTLAGNLRAEQAEDGLIRVHMGKPRTQWAEIPMAEKVDTLHVTELENSVFGVPAVVNMGNPHCVFFVDQIDRLAIESFGKEIEHHALFPERTNVEFIRIIDNNSLDIRVWERGVGETQACGTGACASAFAAFRRGYVGNQVAVNLPGGTLYIDITDNGDVLMKGAVAISFIGTFEYEAYAS